MRLLTVAERELRAAARNKVTHRARWITSAMFLGYLIWLFWIQNGFSNSRVTPDVFNTFAVTIFFFCLFVGATRTADCISSERREGTLGLLFLTNLNSAEIVIGKFCSTALASIYNLLAIFPMLALPLLMGGITLEHFWRTVLALIVSIFFSLACGFVASVVSVRQFTSIAVALGLSLLTGAGLLAAAAIVDDYKGPQVWVQTLASCCPLYSLVAADGSRTLGQNHFWLSLATVAIMSLSALGLVTLRLSQTWRDRPQKVRTRKRFSIPESWRRRANAGSLAMRRRMLNINPFYWLGGRRRVSSPVFMLITVVMVATTVYVLAPAFSYSNSPRSRPMLSLEGYSIAWIMFCATLHALSLYYAAMIASQRLAEDKQAGALELVLCTQTTERAISRGLWQAFSRRMLFPAITCTLAHLFLIWQGATALVMQQSELKHLTPGQLLWRAFFSMRISGNNDDWSFAMVLRIFLLMLVMLFLLWITLGWLGRWLGLRMKHPGFAPLVALALAIVPPVLLFTLACFLFDKIHIYRAGPKLFVPVLVWTAFGLGAVNCLMLSLWAARRLRNDFRTTVTSRFQPPPAKGAWLPSRRTVIRFTLGTAAVVLAGVLAVAGFYGYQNSRSRREWIAFQSQLKKQNEPISLAALLPGPVPDNENFARSQTFQDLLSRKGAPLAKLIDSGQSTRPNSPAIMTGWLLPIPAFSPLTQQSAAGFKPGKFLSRTNRAAVAAMVLQAMQPHDATLRTLSSDAARLSRFQFSTNRDSRSFFKQDSSVRLLDRLKVLFQIRACALLATDHATEAGEDLLTSFRLSRLAGQSSHALSSQRQQTMIMDSLQPLWEGLYAQQWNDAQLSSFQTALSGFNLLAAHTNAIHRLVAAHIEIWSALPDSGQKDFSVPIDGGSLTREDAWGYQPRAWWFDRCIQLHRAGEKAIGKIDVAGGRVKMDYDWADLQDLPVGSDTQQLFQQYYWSGPGPGLVSFMQNAVNQAIIACALERYYIANGKYPDTLDALVPDFLPRIPNDIARGRPMLYQRTDDGRYILRSVGPDGNDDRKKKTSDDWLWWYGTNAPPVKAK